MTTSAHSPRGTASDSLLMQVNSDNILQVRNAYLTQQHRIHSAVQTAWNERRDIRPGKDPISEAYAEFFNRKVDTVLKLHRAHAEELREATDRLSEAAREYGYTEDAIETSFSDFGRKNAGTPGPRVVVDR